MFNLSSLLGLSNNNTDAQTQDSAMTKQAKGKPLALALADKHEPFGAITIEKIKQTLEEENFAQLQSLYHLMMRDLKIASSVLARRQPLLSLDYTISGENTAAIDWIKSQVDIDGLINQLSFAVYYGVSLSDIQYEVVEGKLIPQFKLVSPRYIYAHRDKELKTTPEHLYIKQGDKRRFINKIDPDKIVFHKHPIDIGEITDFSLASKLVWYFSLKHLALAHNLQYFDSVATPPLIAKAGEGDEKALIDNLYQLKSASVGVFDKDAVIEYLNVSSKADFLAFIEYIDRQIVTLVLGNTLSTGEGSKGSFSQSKTHENRQIEVRHFDARLIAKTVTDFLNRLEKLNFSQPKGITFAFDLKEQRDLKSLSEVVKNLSDSGYELDTEDMERQFGFKIMGKKTTQESAPAAAPKAQQNNQQQNSHPIPKMPCGCLSPQSIKPTAKPHDTLDKEQPGTRAIEQAMLNQIEQLLANATDYDDAHTQLLAAYPTFSIDELEASLFKAIANSALLAEAHVN